MACEVCTERGVGIEYECRTLPPDCERSFTKEDQLRALLDDCLALPGLPERVTALLRRLAFWQITTDPAVCVFERGCARQLAAAFADPEAAERALTVQNATVPSEFKSPLPPREISFADADAAAEVALFVRLARRCGVSAPTLTDACESGTAIHIHVNVRN